MKADLSGISKTKRFTARGGNRCLPRNASRLSPNAKRVLRVRVTNVPLRGASMMRGRGRASGKLSGVLNLPGYKNWAFFAIFGTVCLLCFRARFWLLFARKSHDSATNTRTPRPSTMASNTAPGVETRARTIQREHNATSLAANQSGTLDAFPGLPPRRHASSS